MKSTKTLRIAVLGLLFFWGLIAFPIGRSGDGKSVSSVPLGFEANVPTFYNQTKQYKDGTLSIYYLTFSSSIGVEEQSLRFHSLDAIYPELRGTTKTSAAEFLNKAGGTTVQMSDNCIQAYRINSNSLVYTVFQWSPTKGVVVMGKRDSITMTSLREVESSFKLLEGACGWN
jgi:hypothetical protein